MNVFKKIISYCLLIIFVLLLSGCGYSCNKVKLTYTEYNYGDIIIIKNRYSPAVNGRYGIVGFTKEGEEKKTITFPTYFINENNKIDSIGIKHVYIGKNANFVSDNLEIIYLTKPMTFNGKYMFNCPNLKRIICLSKEEYTREYFIDYDGPIVYSYTDLDEIWLDCHYFYPGNIQYLDSLSDELYYLDFYDGGLIEDMPWTPVKDGYTFIGWYKEKECINKWDFDKDEVSKLEHKETGSYREDGSPIKKDYYTVTRIYAKWEKNDEIN